MYGQPSNFRPSGGGRGSGASHPLRQQQVQFCPNILPNPNLFFIQPNPNILAPFNPFFQNPNIFPQGQQQLPNPNIDYLFNRTNPILLPAQLNSERSNFQAPHPENEYSNTKFAQRPVKEQSQMVEKVDKAARSAWKDLLNSNKSVSLWKVSQEALLAVKVESWESLGFQMQQVPSLKSLLVTEGKINAFIHCFVAARRITSLYDLEVAVCESEGVKQFEELELGPLVQHPLAVHYFSLTSNVTEVYRIRTEDIISFLCQFIDTHKKNEIKDDTFLDFICKKQSVSGREKLGVLVQDLRLYVNHIEQAKESEDSVLVHCYEKIRKESRKHSRKHPLFSVQEKETEENFNTISQRLKSFSSENTQFCGRHTRFISSSSEDDDSEDSLDDKKFNTVSQRLKSFSSENTQFCGTHTRFISSSSEDDDSEDSLDDKNTNSNYNLLLPNGRSEHVSSCPYPSANEELRRLGLKSEVESTSYMSGGGVRRNTDHNHVRGKRRSENMSPSTSIPRKLPKKEKLDEDVKLKCSGYQSVSGHSLSSKSLRIFISTWKEAFRDSNPDEVRSTKFLTDIGLKTEVTLDDALSILRLWRKLGSHFKASVSQMSNFYAYLWKGMTHSKKKVMKELHSGPFIFVPNTISYSDEDPLPGSLMSPQEIYWHDKIGSVDLIKSVHPQCDSTLASYPQIKMLHTFYPHLHDFFVRECGVDEGPPFSSYLQILQALSAVALPRQAAKRVFEVFLIWDDALRSGSMSSEDVEFLKENFLKKEYTVLPTRQDKWVSLHSSFGLVCWSDDDKLERVLRHLEGIDILCFGESTLEENEIFPAKLSVILQRLGIPALSEIVTREAIPYGPEDSSSISSLVNWVLPYAQRYIYSTDREKYFKLKQSCFENLKQLKIVVLEKLFYRYKIKKRDITSKRRHQCNCLLQENILYCSRESDPHSIFLELSCLVLDGTLQLHLANFLHMITAMAQSGATEEQTESFILNSQKVPKLPAEESSWSLQDTVVTRSNWPPVDWKTWPGSDKIDTCLNDINIEFNIDDISTAVVAEAKAPQSQCNILNVAVDSADFVSLDSRDEALKQQQAMITGRLGEHVAFKYFSGKVGDRSVNWVNEACETGLPYDIVLEGDESNTEYVEVKATRYGRNNWFPISLREWQFAIEKGESFSIAYVILADDNMAKVTIFKNPARLCQLGNLRLALVLPRHSTQNRHSKSST